MRGRQAILGLIFVSALLLSGCSHYAHWQYERAEKFEAQSKLNDAVGAYTRAVDYLPISESKLRSQAWARMGDCLWRMKRLTDAFGAYERATEYDVGNFNAQLRLGELYLAAGSAERAAERARFVLIAQSENPEALSLMGAAAGANGNMELARLAYERAVEVDPKRVNAAVALADLLNRADETDQARAVLVKAINADATSSDPWLALGRLEEQDGKTSAAEIAYRRAVSINDSSETNLRLAQFLQRTSRFEEARTLLRRVDAMRPASPVAVGDSELSSGRADLALDAYMRGLRSQPQEQPFQGLSSLWHVSEPTIAETGNGRSGMAARVVEADLQHASAQRDDASRQSALGAARLHLDQFRTELDSATIDLLEAEIAVLANDAARASAYAATAVLMAPESASARYVNGVVKYRSGNREAALADWREALERAPSFVPARIALAAHELRFGNPDAAEDYVVRAVRDEPANFAALILFARVLASTKKFSSAEVVARRAAALDSTSPEPHVVLGETAASQKKYATALAEYEQAILLDPHSQAAIDGLTRVYRAGLITKPLLQTFEKVAAAKPPSPTLMEVAGRLYADRGWNADARRCYQTTLQMDPSRTSAARAMAILDLRSGATAAPVYNNVGGNSGAMLAAIQAEQRGDDALAIKNYEEAMRVGDRDGAAANNLAWLLARKGDLNRAVTYAERARQAAPHDPAVLDTLGYVYLLRREYSKAVPALEEARRFAAGHANDSERPQLAAEINSHLAEAYLRSGDTDRADNLKPKLDVSAVGRASRERASHNGPLPALGARADETKRD